MEKTTFVKAINSMLTEKDSDFCPIDASNYQFSDDIPTLTIDGIAHKVKGVEKTNNNVTIGVLLDTSYEITFVNINKIDNEELWVLADNVLSNLIDIVEDDDAWDDDIEHYIKIRKIA